MSDKTAVVMLGEILQNVGSVREIFDSVYEQDRRALLTDFYTDLDAIEDATKALIDKCLDFGRFMDTAQNRSRNECSGGICT